MLQEAEQVPEAVTEEALNEPRRRDLRDWTIVTIDGEDAKDLDDAVSVVRLAPDRWQLGVHIAGAGRLRPRGPRWTEAYRRGTSVYLADRVVPMLPPRLSNGICSLNPGVDRLTLSCVMEIDGRARVRSYAIFPSVIRTAARLTYTRVNAILNDEPGRPRAWSTWCPCAGRWPSSWRCCGSGACAGAPWTSICPKPR